MGATLSLAWVSLSVILVKDLSVNFEEHSGKITFDLIKARLSNRGDTDRVIIVRGCQPRCEVETTCDHIGAQSREWSRGDNSFFRGLRAMPPRIRALGKELVAEIRSELGGSLRYHSTSKTYVQTPDNSWAVRIQPEDRSLRIVVRGEPDYFGPVTGITLKPDRTSYSSFKISKLSQLAAALSIIKMAQRE